MNCRWHTAYFRYGAFDGCYTVSTVDAPPTHCPSSRLSFVTPGASLVSFVVVHLIVVGRLLYCYQPPCCFGMFNLSHIGRVKLASEKTGCDIQTLGDEMRINERRKMHAPLTPKEQTAGITLYSTS